MSRSRVRGLMGLMFLFLSGCNQPFEPEGPVGQTLVVYGILNPQSRDQYVRISTTYHAPGNGELPGARVELVAAEQRVQLRDTVIERKSLQGTIDRYNVYVAPNYPVTAGTTYELKIVTPDGATGSASTVALQVPTLSLDNTASLGVESDRPSILRTSFGSVTGAFDIHFYLDYYAFVDEAWKLFRTEVPERSYKDGDGNEVFVYPQLARVIQASGASTGPIVQFDTLEYRNTRRRVNRTYTAENVVWTRAVFVLTQVDDALYSYYYLNNGPIDRSSIRLDVPEFTNTTGGLGVFGSSATAVLEFPMDGFNVVLSSGLGVPRQKSGSASR